MNTPIAEITKKAKLVRTNHNIQIIDRINPISQSSKKAEILILTSYPPRECGIATYSNDLVKSLNDKFGDSLLIRICAVENNNEQHHYGNEVTYILNTDRPSDYPDLASEININRDIQIVLVQHEFGFYVLNEDSFVEFLKTIKKKKIVVLYVLNLN